MVSEWMICEICIVKLYLIPWKKLKIIKVNSTQCFKAIYSFLTLQCKISKIRSKKSEQINRPKNHLNSSAKRWPSKKYTFWSVDTNTEFFPIFDLNYLRKSTFGSRLLETRSFQSSGWQCQKQAGSMTPKPLKKFSFHSFPSWIWKWLHPIRIFRDRFSNSRR